MKGQDKKFLARDVPSNNIEITKTEGNYLISANGKKYLDFVTGWCVGNLGWGNKEIKKAITQYNGPDYVSPSFLYQPWVELAELLATITPGKLSKSFRATGGTEAVDIALRIANIYTQRSKFISIEGSYHGDSIGTLSVGSSSYRKHHKNLLFKSFKIKPPLDQKAVKQVEEWLKSKKIAALIMEPIVCNLGVVIPEQEFMTQIEKLCKKYGTLLIMDEVATGFGRTGKLFATEHFGIKPDMMIMAKGITGGYAPMGAVITTPEVAKVMEFESSYYSTYGWHPLSVAVALANIKYLLKNKKTLQQNIIKTSEYFRDRLMAMNFKQPAEINIAGLGIGVEFKSGHYAQKIVERARKKGLILSLHNEKQFTMFPALNINKKVAKEGLDILEECL